MAKPEEIMQISFCVWLRHTLKTKLNIEGCDYHIANERITSPQRGAKLKKAGVLSGVFDHFIMVANKDYHGLYIELKVKPNKPSANQIKFQINALEQGYLASVCYSLEEAQDVVNDYFGL